MDGLAALAVVVVAYTLVASKLDRLPRRAELVVGDSDELVHLDWSEEWSGAQ